MVSSTQYAGFGDMGKELKNFAQTSGISALVSPLGTVGSLIVMSILMSRAYSFLGGDYDAISAFTQGCLIATLCIIGALYLLLYLAILNYRIRAFKAMKTAGEQSGNPNISALAKHWFVELIMMVATAPLYAVTGIALAARSFMPYGSTSTASEPLLLLANWFAMAITGMYSMVDGHKKWGPVGQLLTSYKGRAGMNHLTTSFGVGFAIFIISHYVMAYLLVAASYVGSCTGGSYYSYCSTLNTMAGILVPVGIACGIMTLIAVVNHIKGLFRVGNTFIDLEEGRVGTSPSAGTYYRPTQATLYSAPNGYGTPATGGGYQHGTWNAPRYSQSMQPMQPVEPVRLAAPTQPAYRDTSAIEPGWHLDSGPAAKPTQAKAPGRCKSCQAILPANEDVAFCPYCGASV